MNLESILAAHQLIAGVDEAGRGPLAGPVVVAAVILPAYFSLAGLDDSKKVSEPLRQSLFPMIRDQALAYSVQVIEPAEIEELNILGATLRGMQVAVNALNPTPTLTLIDGNKAPELDGEVHAIIGGDSLVPAISAASILAKVTRDTIMKEYHSVYPAYGFDRNKGYPTGEHLQRLKELGPCPIHRKTFAPVRESLERQLF